MDPVEFFKCLGDSTRLKSLLLIQRQRELCVCELMVALEEVQPKISRHLALLKKNGLLLDRRQGQWVYYRLNTALPDWCLQVIAKTSQDNEIFIAKDLQRLEKMGDRPQRIQSCCES